MTQTDDELLGLIRAFMARQTGEAGGVDAESRSLLDTYEARQGQMDYAGFQSLVAEAKRRGLETQLHGIMGALHR